MIISRYDIQQVTSDKFIEQKILNMASKFAIKVGFKRTGGLSECGKFVDTRSFDIELLIKAYQEHSANTSRTDLKHKYEKFENEMIDIKNKIQEMRK